MDSAALLSLIDALAGRRVAVVGDMVADEFVYGRLARVSREAPVLILEYDSTQVVAGGAGNAANNVAALGGRVALVSAVGRDEAGRRAIESLSPRVNHRLVQRIAGTPTVVKTRILAGGVHSAKQQVVRIDRGVGQPVSAAARRAVEEAALRVLPEVDAILLSDYGSGLVGPALARRLRSALRRARHPIPLLVDSRFRLLEYRGLTACTPNESEVEAALGVRINDDPRALERAGRDILRRTGMDAVIVTRGSRGMALFVGGQPTQHVPTYGSDEVADVTGAGDTVVATVALALAGGASFEGAARLANYAGGLVVMKRGTATVGADELRAAVRSDAGAPRADGGAGTVGPGPRAGVPRA